MKKTYVAIYNNQVHKFDTWADCKKYIQDKESVKYKSFTDPIAIKQFIDGNIKKNISTHLPDVLYAFVRGSYTTLKDTDAKYYNYGAAMVINDAVCHCISGSIEPSVEALPGELMATLKAIQYAIKRKEPRIIIVYSFLGTEMYANRTWIPKKDVYSAYINQIDQYRKAINIDFLPVDKNDSKTFRYSNEAYILAKKENQNQRRRP